MSATRVRSVERIHARLRTAIISGDYRPGTVLSQVELARNFGVSRTPLREAMRRLEAEGLIEAVQNQRARVATVDAETLDVMFTERILIEAMGVKVTVPFLTEIDLNALLAATAALRMALAEPDVRVRDEARRSLHARYIARAGTRLQAAIVDQFDGCERHRRVVFDLPPDVQSDYVAIAGACIARDAGEVSLRIARIEVRFASEVLKRANAGYEPTAIRTALQMLETAGKRPVV